MNHRLAQTNNHFSSQRMPMWTLRTFVPFDFTPSETGSLKGQTIFITGASRGIGLEIAKRCARDGANVAIAAKTVTEQPNLAGTIYTAAKEIEQAGGKALPIQCDIRDADSVKAAIEKTVATFGGLDILINNASAINPTGVEDMEVKRFDLIQSINARGTFVASKFAIPHLRKSRNPHILTISPPLYMGNDVSIKNNNNTLMPFVHLVRHTLIIPLLFYYTASELVRQDGFRLRSRQVCNDLPHSWTRWRVER